ncbi:Hypothetical protein SMAX5B_014876 [Scophthalmus maximus]|uniref:Hematopoietic progenitor cell antigen CD34 n=1 Tax=Scophthalmus maximus TaxID=52904 RepID=A0A2U9C3A4_SCOMX|nr:Hypothetical protein SMAX5B_014876 [Scophthalmus maximus]
MSVSMWRMNGLWRRMAGVLVLCVLLLSDGVICQDDAAEDPAVPSAANPTAGAVVGNSPFPATVINIALGGDSQDGDASGTIAAPLDAVNKAVTDGEVPNVIQMVVPEVKCVGKEEIPESDAVKALVATDDCEATKRIIQGNAAGWCKSENCNLKIFQDGNTLLVASENAKLGSLADALQSENLKDKLGVTKIETPSSSGSSVFVGILVTGLLAAIAITVGYLKCPRRSDAKGVRLADEAYPVDQENQGNTLVSVAPLNPPPETQEKPSVNGESPEADKTQAPPPPTNGHSTAKTADTEL